MRRSPWFLVLAIAVVGALPLSAAAPASAAERSADPKRAEAKARFDRGMHLLEEHDDAGALAELRRAYDLVPERQTLLVIGVLWATMNRPVEAVTTLDRVLADPGALSEQQLGVARARRAEQALKVAYLRVVTSAPATIEVDGVDVAHTPIATPIAVAAGTRLVAALSPGYLPMRREIAVAGGVTETAQFDLVPSELRAAHLFVRTKLPDAEVIVDGERVARTPLDESITVLPGKRLVELRRAGYQTAASTIVLGDGATGELAFAPTEIAAGGSGRGTLAIDVSEPDPDLDVDGAARGVYRGPLALPAGRHLVRVVRGGFVPVERLVEVPASGAAQMRATLTPTPELRAVYVAHARTVRRWGWFTALSGAAVAAGGGIFLAKYLPELRRAHSDRDVVLAAAAPGQPCYKNGPTRDIQECEAELAAANDRVSTLSLRANLSGVALGVGAVALGVGVYLLLSGDDPGRYDSPRYEPLARAPFRLEGYFVERGGGLAAVGRF